MPPPLSVFQSVLQLKFLELAPVPLFRLLGCQWQPPLPLLQLSACQWQLLLSSPNSLSMSKRFVDRIYCGTNQTGYTALITFQRTFFTIVL
jgi:hypothetical protein